jgi:hypothetical protein
MFAISSAAGVLGFAGMLLGRTLICRNYARINALVQRNYKEAGLPTEDAAYENLSIDPVSNELCQNRRDKAFRSPCGEKGGKKKAQGESRRQRFRRRRMNENGV